MNRRQFMKGTIGATVLAGSLCPTLYSLPARQCGNCKITLPADPCSGFFSLIRKSNLYCPNCGVELLTLIHDLPCEEYDRCRAQNTPACISDRKRRYGTCFQVPFPNGQLLERNKPVLQLVSLKF